MVGAKRLSGKDFVVGKSMALRRDDLARLGGFQAVKDLLAEDYVLGRMISHLGKRVVIARSAVYNVSRDRALSDFVRRYARWAVMHRQAVGSWVYLCEPLLNPVPFALFGAATAPSVGAASLALLALTWRMLLDSASAALLRPRGFRLRQLLAVPLRDLLLLGTWAYGFATDAIEWRSNRLRVLPGTRLARPADGDPQLLEDAV
jgi:ceramide glucosyltransferase